MHMTMCYSCNEIWKIKCQRSFKIQWTLDYAMADKVEGQPQIITRHILRSLVVSVVSSTALGNIPK